jgi:hypothetical protein
MGIAVGTDLAGLKEIGHGGSIDGFVSQASWYPDGKLAIVVLMNSAGPVSPGALTSELARAILPPVPPPPVKAFTGDMAPFTGTYSGPSRGRVMDVVVTATPQGLSAAVNGNQPRQLQWVDGWVFRVGNSYLTFKRSDETGPAAELRFDGGGGLYVLKRK